MSDVSVVKKYVVCGPFPRKSILWDGEESFYIDYLTSVNGEEGAELRAGMAINGASCVEVEGDESGFVDLVKLYGEVFKDFWRLEHGVAYAYSELRVSEDGHYVLLLGAEDYASLYVNGELVFSTRVARKYEDSFYAIPVRLVRGTNRVLIKIARSAGGWGFSLKLVKPSSPVYVNERRTITPKPKAGSRVAEWIGLHVLALKDAKVRVMCVEDTTWYSCSSEELALRAGERVQIPIYVISKKPLTERSEVKLLLRANDSELLLRVSIDVSYGNHVVHTYRSRFDGSVHRYGVKVPANFGGQGKYPAVIILHGFKGLQMYSEIFGDKDWVFAVGITARDGEVNYREIGLLEVLEVIEDLARRYPIDPKRLYLMGHSMGGYGTWYIGVKYPHLFAALAPHSSRGDLTDTVEKVSKIPGWSGVAELMDMYNPVKYLENILNTPVYVAHGSEDNIVPVSYSREMAKKLRELGVEHVYEEVLGKKHWWGSYTPGSYFGAEAIDRPALEDFLKSKVKKTPKRVKAVTESTRFSKVWWVEFSEIAYKGLAKVDIEVFPGTNIIKIHSVSNVVELAVDLNELVRENVLSSSGDIVVDYSNKYLVIPQSLLRDKLVLRIYEGYICSYHDNVEVCSDGSRTWTRTCEKTLKLPNKNLLPGPFMDIFNGRVFVVPCTDAAFAKECRKVALWLQSWFLDYANGLLRIIDHNEVLAESVDELANIIAIGGPEVNKYTESVIDYVKPVRIKGYAIRVREKKYIGENYGIALIYPNPRAKYRRYLGLLGGNSVISVKPLYRLDPTTIPDYVVYDANNLGARVSGIVESGFFDVYWE